MNRDALTDYLIVGQGISGTVLANMLADRSKSVIVIDECPESTSTKIAAGIVNPVTGKNFVKTWLADDIIPFARYYYNYLGNKFKKTFLAEKLIYRGLNDIGAENRWLSRTTDPDYEHYCKEFESFDAFENAINPLKNYGVVSGGFQVNLALLMQTTREWLASSGRFRKETFDYDALSFDEKYIRYKDLKAERIIFCEGFRGENNPFFKDLPFSPSKGEVLFVKIPDARFTNLIKHENFIAHLKDDIYWVGGGYEWRADDEHPSDGAKEKLISALKSMLKLPYEIVDHKAAVRPATKDRRPLLIQHSQHTNMYFFNGMGTKGTSLTPFFADRLVKHLEENAAL